MLESVCITLPTLGGDGDHVLQHTLGSAMAAHAGGSLVERPVAFTTDSKHMMCCSGAAVKLFSCETGALLRVLEGHTDIVYVVQPVLDELHCRNHSGLLARARRAGNNRHTTPAQPK